MRFFFGAYIMITFIIKNLQKTKQKMWSFENCKPQVLVKSWHFQFFNNCWSSWKWRIITTIFSNEVWKILYLICFSATQMHCVEILVSLPDFSIDLLLSYWDDGMGRFKTKICTSFDCPSWNNLEDDTSNIKRILIWFVVSGQSS